MRLGLGTDISVGYRQPLFGGVPFLLDTYSGAAAAYSLRQLRTGVANVVRVRRDTTPSAEQDFTAKEITDGTLLSFVGAGNNGYVVTWYDQSGNTGRDATQTTAASQPKIVDAGVLVEENGKPALKFESAQDLFNAYNVQELNTIISISSSLDSVTEQSVYNMHLGDGSRGFSLGYNRNAPNSIGSTTRDPLFAFYESGEDLPNLNQKLFTQIGSCASGSAFNNLYINSTIGSQLYNCRSTGTGGIAIGSRDGLFYLNGTLQEIIIYNSDQSSNRTGIESNINDHYNIYP